MRTEEGLKKAKEARAKYNRENFKSVGANVKIEDYEQLKRIAERDGTTIGAMVRNSIDSILAKEKDQHQEFYDAPTCSVTLGYKLFEEVKRACRKGKYNPDTLVRFMVEKGLDIMNDF